jgi:hypothetical protein
LIAQHLCARQCHSVLSQGEGEEAAKCVHGLCPGLCRQDGFGVR